MVLGVRIADTGGRGIIVVGWGCERDNWVLFFNSGVGYKGVLFCKNLKLYIDDLYVFWYV